MYQLEKNTLDRSQVVDEREFGDVFTCGFCLSMSKLFMAQGSARSSIGSSPEVKIARIKKKKEHQFW